MYPMTTSMHPLSEATVRKTAELFSTLAHPGRLRILWHLAKHPEDTVGHVANRLGMDQSALSHQLRLLRDANLVVARRAGKTMQYALVDQHVVDIIHDALAHANE